MKSSLILCFFVSGLNYFVATQTTVCDGVDKTIGCLCIAESLQIICENLTNFTSANLAKVGTSITVNFNLLYIINTDINEIITDSFKSSYERIFVQNNNALETIAKNAFKDLSTTTELVFKNNKKLTGDIIGLIPLTKQLQIIDFRGNKLSDVPAESFNNASNQKDVQFISLDNQTSDGLLIASKAFGNLPKLRQLSLDNSVKTLADNSIDLRASLSSIERLDIYMEKSKLLTWSNKSLIVPTTPKPAVWLSLRGQVSLGDNIDYYQFKDFFNQENNRLFVTSTDNKDCVCDNVRELLKLNDIVVKVNGLQCKQPDLCINS